MTQSSLQDIPAGVFTESTIKRMYGLVDKAKVDPAFQKIVYDIVNRSMRGQWKQYGREISAVLNWFKRNHDYRRDPNGVELLQDVWATMDRRRFDCDDASIFMGAAIEVLGAPARLVTVSTSPTKEPGHVYVQALVDGRWQGVDAIVQSSYLGWEPPNITAKQIWDRRVLGLSGWDEKLGDLGMDNQSMPEAWVYDNYNASRSGMIRRGGVNWEGGFADRMFEVNPTGVPNDISKTFAPGMPGDQVNSRRTIPSSLISPTADPFQTDKAGGGTFAAHYPIESNPNISERRSTVDPADVPFILNPDQWTGSVPDAVMEPGYMDPQPFVSQDDYIRDLAGLGIDLRKENAQTRRALLAEYRACMKKCRDDYRAKMRAAGFQDPALKGLSPEQGGPVVMLAPPRGGSKALSGLSGWFDSIVLPSPSMDPGAATAIISAAITSYAGMFFPSGTPDFIKNPAISSATDSLVKRWVSSHNDYLASQIKAMPVLAARPGAAVAIGTGTLVAGLVAVYFLTKKK